jgi:hypothetical protein
MIGHPQIPPPEAAHAESGARVTVGYIRVRRHSALDSFGQS